MNKLSNQEKIRKAYAMNYAAQISVEHLGKLLVITIDEEIGLIYFRLDNDEIISRTFDQVNYEVYEIKEYLYMGQLGGNEPIPPGQKFRVKDTGEIVKAIRILEVEIDIEFEGGKRGLYPKTELKPYFE